MRFGGRSDVDDRLDAGSQRSVDHVPQALWVIDPAVEKFSAIVFVIACLASYPGKERVRT
jgi:hypothetical protein